MFGHVREGPRSLSERAAVLALVAGMRGEWHRAATLIDATGSALGLIEGRWEALAPDEVPLAEQLRRGVSDGAISRHEASIARLEGSGIRVVTVLDDDYPVNLRMVFNRPPVLFVSGALEPANRRAIAVVGTGRPSAAGVERSGQLGADLARLGFAVVAALDGGVETAGHRAALAAGGRAIAVLGAGIGRVQPAERRELADAIAFHGAVVSPFWPDASPDPIGRPLRNAVLSGLSAAVVVVEGPADGRAAALARAAFGHGRPVLFVEGLSAREEWVRRSLGQGLGRVVGCADEIDDATRLLTEPPTRATLP
jgi:DNA processing protein